MYLRYPKSVFGMRVGSVALAAWMVLGLFGTASALAGKPPPPPPPPADPAIVFTHQVISGRGHNQTVTNYVAVCNADGTNATDLVAVPGNVIAEYFSWAPDGRSIAFTNGRNTDSPGVWRLDVSAVNGVPVGSGLTQLVALTSSNARGVDWSPLGDRIVYNDGPAKLYTIPAGGGTPELISQRLPAFHPRWSQDGRHVVFLANDFERGMMDIRMLDLATGSETTVAWLGDWVSAGLDWGNTSNLFTFTDVSALSSNLYLVNGNSGAITQLNATVGNSTGSFSPDDSQLVYDAIGNNLAVYTISTGAIATLPAIGTCPEWRRNP